MHTFSRKPFFFAQLVALEAGKGQVTIVKVEAVVEDVDHPMGGERNVLDNTIEYIKVGWQLLESKRKTFHESLY